MTTDTKEFATDMFHQAADSFKKTMEAGIKVQEQFTKMWMVPMTMPSNFEDMRKRGEKISTDYVSLMEKNMQQIQRSFDEQSKTTMDLMKKAFDAAKGQNPSEIQNRSQELFQSSMDSVKNFTDTLVKTNTQIMENWSNLMGSAFNGHQAEKAPAPAMKK